MIAKNQLQNRVVYVGCLFKKSSSRTQRLFISTSFHYGKVI